MIVAEKLYCARTVDCGRRRRGKGCSCGGKKDVVFGDSD